jgi:hypothetical protein
MFEVITTLTVKVTVLWDVTECNLVDSYHRLEGTYCF